MMAKPMGIGLYEFLIESELQHYYNAIKNDLKVQSVLQLKYVTEDDMTLIGMSRPEIRRLKKYFQKHYPQTYLAKMKKKLLSKKEEPIVVTSLPSQSPNAPGRPVKSVAPGRHIIQAESIVIHKTLGSGEFGTVQQGVWTSDDGQRTQVAIKCLSQDRMENNPVEFLKEAAIMHSVDHEHIVRLYGVVLDTSALMLVTELAPLRSLLECLKEPSMLPNLGVPTLYDFAVQICDGMQYLESKRLIHRDLAARNILVFSRNKVKISDFGLSRALGVGKDYYQTNFNVNLKLPIAWCAPECINFLRFTSSSDVWAYGVTLWEMFSYGFQPWAALTGQQILEAIDEPNHQRLEKPECCPNEIYSQIMLKCWHHDPSSRPTFAQLSHLILEVKPEQVQAIMESDSKNRRDFIAYESGDVITVLDRTFIQASPDVVLWKGVLKCGKSGYFNPANTITYLGSNLPTVKQTLSPFQRNDSRSSSLRKSKISADMISGPQGDLKHTGHVGTDGQVFGDITFLGAKCWVPRQVVPPYVPEPNAGEINGARRLPSTSSSLCQDMTSSDTAPLLDTVSTASRDEGPKPSTSGARKMRPMISLPGASSFGASPDHEYHEISDEENECMGAAGGGVSNPALSSKSQSPIDSPRFEKTFDLDLGGPSLIDEVFSALESDTPDHIDEAHNVKNELRELARTKKRFVSVKPISSSDRRTLDHAIQMANDMASKSMLDLDRSGKGGMTNSSLDDISSPRTPNSPTHRKKFSFMLGSSKADRERRNYSQEAASIADIQSTLTEEARDAYNSLIEKPAMGSLGFLTPSFANKSMSFNFPEKCTSKKADFFEPESKALNAPQSLTEISAPSTSTSAPPVSTFNVTNFPGKFHCRSFSKNDADEIAPIFAPPEPSVNPPLPPRTKSTESLDEEVDGNPLRLLRQNKLSNVLPLPPKKSHLSGSTTMRHQRKHPLLIPNRVQLSTTLESTSSKPISAKSAPAPPPKPQRTNSTPASAVTTSTLSMDQQPSTSSASRKIQKQNTFNAPSQNGTVPKRRESSIESDKSKDSVLLYENIVESEEPEPVQTKPVNLTNGHGQTAFKERSPSVEKLTTSVLKSSSSSSLTSKLNQLQMDSQPAAPSAEPEYQPSSSCTNGSFFHRCNSSPVSATSTLNSEVQASTTAEAPKPFKISPGNSIKIKTLQRILGSTATDQDCEWALNATDADSAHAVKLLRLKALLPETLMSSNDASHIVSVLEMSHWDVARAASFLLEQGSLQNKPVAKPRLKIQSSYPDHRSSPPRSDPITITNPTTSDSVNNNNDPLPTTNGNYVRPTQV